MPLVIVHAATDDPSRRDACLAAIPVALAPEIGSVPEAVWPTWVTVDGQVVGGEPRHPGTTTVPVVVVHARPGRTADQIAAGLTAVAGAVAGALGVDLTDVWVRWQEIPAGQAFTGGQVV